MTQNRLYELLPIFYRQRDLEQGFPLLAFLNIMELELNILEQNIEELYSNWFIETCEDWVIPYLATLIGTKFSDQTSHLLGTARLQVANTLRNRRRKGTLKSLENILYESTNLPAKIIPYFVKLSITQNLENINLDRGKTLDLHSLNNLELINTINDPFARTIDISVGGSNPLLMSNLEIIANGKYNIYNIGIFLYPLRSFFIQFAQARHIQDNCYTFNPLGIDSPLFKPPSNNQDNQTSVNNSLPIPLTPSDLQPLIKPNTASEILVNSLIDRPPLQIFIFLDNGSVIDLNNYPNLTLQVTDLSKWPNLQEIDNSICVDLKCGRMVLPANLKTNKVLVNYAYGFSAEIGGGSYSRRQTLSNVRGIWRGNVSQLMTDAPRDKNSFSSLTEAIQAWSQSDLPGIISISDNCIYNLEEDSNFAIIQEVFVERQTPFSLTIEAADGCRPCLLGNLNIIGRYSGSKLVLNGLWLNGTISVTGKLQLVICHCTVWNKKAAIKTLESSENIDVNLEVRIAHSILSSIYLFSDNTVLDIHNSIIDGSNDRNQYAIASNKHLNKSIYTNCFLKLLQYKAFSFWWCVINLVDSINAEVDNNWGPETKIEQTTVIGRTKITMIIAANSVIFTEPILVQKRQEGYISFSYVPSKSKTPSQYRCQPDYSDSRSELLQPFFVSRIYGNPGYAQLSYMTPIEIFRGAENGSQMGILGNLSLSEKLTNLQAVFQDNFPAINT